MKKLIMFVMVLMLCLGLSTAKADLVAGYSFDSTLDDCSGNDNHGEVNAGSPAYSGDVPTLGSGGMSLDLNGLSSVITPVDTCMFDGSSDFSVMFWFKTAAGGGIAIGVGSPDGSEGDNGEHSLTFFYDDSEGSVFVFDVWYTGNSTTEDFTYDGGWHHYALTYTASTETEVVYIDGAVDGPEETPEVNFDCGGTGSALTIGDILTDACRDDLELDPWTGQLKDVGIFDSALTGSMIGDYMSLGFKSEGPRNPISVDPNASMLVYETNTTESAFRVSLNMRPVGQGYEGNQGDPYSLTVLIDPNGGNGGYGEGPISEKDIVLLAGAGDDNQITLTFTPTTSYGYDANCPEYTFAGGVGTSCWDYPVEIKYMAIDDPCAEPGGDPPSLFEAVPIAVTMTSVVAEPNLNGPLDAELNPWEAGDPQWSRIAGASVKDNDQAVILSVQADGETEQLNPLHIMEELLGYTWGGDPIVKTQTVRIKLQIPIKNDADPCHPENAYVRVEMVKEGGGEPGEPEYNPPIADPCLLPYGPGEPNAIVFTNRATGVAVPGVFGGDFQNWNDPYEIVIQGVNDDKLQVEPGESDGSQNYSASLNFSVEQSTDKRYGEDVQQYDDQGDPIPDLFEWVALDLSVPIDVQDNECGAFGILSLDLVGNPNETTDPNIPDCYVDIWDVLEIAGSWLDCDDPHDPNGCAPFPDPYLDEEEE